MPEPDSLDYETPKPASELGKPKTNYWLLFYIIFVLVSMWMAFYILATVAGVFFGIFWIFAQVVVWVLTIDLHRNPKNPADDMNAMRKILLGLGMAVCLVSLLVRLFHY